MAGRPAAVRGGGLTGLHYGLFTFIGIAVLALIAFVLQLNAVKKAEADAKIANDRMRGWGSPPAYYADEANATRNPVFAVMNDHLTKLSTMLTGKGEMVQPQIAAELEKLRADIQRLNPGAIGASEPILSALRRLNQALVEARQLKEAQAQELKDVQAENRSLKEGVKAAQDQYRAEVASLNTRIEQLSKEKDDAIASKERQLGDIQTASDALRTEFNQFRVDSTGRERDMGLQSARLQNQNSELQKKIQELKPSSFDASAMLTKADGKVIRAIPGSDVVYVNLGGRQRLKLGMGFEVYSPTREAAKDLRGKASLEVVTLMDDSAECRVTRTTPGQPIIEGDMIVNIAYERNRLPKFVVRGDFDLNYDGEVDFDGAERIAALIKEWGGQVVAELDETTDFVIVGVPPEAPAIAPGEVVSPVLRAQADSRALERSRFQALIQQARSLFIPVITQNAFLYLTGYSGERSIAAR
ncbi:MAG: hypothetical protein U1D55_04505 [Phycisphaerae bacterium]